MSCLRISPLFAVLLCIVMHTELIAQFEDVSSQLGALPPLPTTYNGNGVSFADFNYDGWDDLTFGRGNQQIAIYENVNGLLTPASFSIPNLNQRQVHAVIWADYDNDGDNDVLITKEHAPIELWQNDGAFNFTNVADAAGLEQMSLMYNGAAFCDFDHDGDLDLYFAKFYHPTVGVQDSKRNVFYRNNGDGSFTNITEEAGVLVGQRPCFQPVFLDYNNDGWEDLYLITDRVFVENALFLNNQDGTFTNVTVESGAGIMICSMTGSVSDFDRDADLDVFISNGPSVGSKLVRNNGNGTFTEAADDYGLNIHQLGWGGEWLDYDNDGWDDLFMGLTNNGMIPFTGNHFYRNNGSGLFTDVSDEMNTGNMLETYVCAKADFDHDGRYDLMTNNDSDHPPRLFRNVTPAGNSVSVTLEGVVSNAKGIGAWMTCYMGDSFITKQKLCGENLNAQIGDRFVFGIGELDAVDSLVIEWNRGIRDVYYDLSAGTHIHAIEGHSQYHNLALEASVASVCPGDLVTLSVGEFASYAWSDGSTTPEITVSSNGSYFVTVTTEAGYSFTTEPYAINYPSVPQFSADIVHQQCYGVADASVELTVNGTEWGALWMNGEESFGFAENLLPGYHSFTFTDVFGCSYTDSILVVEAQPIITLISTENVLCNGESTGEASALAFGGQPPYVYDWQGVDPTALPAGVHSVVVIDGQGCSATESFIVEEPDALEVALMVANATESSTGSAVANILGGTAPYTLQWSTGENTADAIFGLAPGSYSVAITDANGCWVEESFEVEFMVGIREANTNELQLYPNPVRDRMQISGCTATVPFVRIVDLSGREVMQFSGTASSLAHLASGRYLAIIECESTVRIPVIKLP